MISATRGESGEISDPALATPKTLGRVRENELREAMAAVRVTDVRFLGYRDSGMADTSENKHPDAFVRRPVDQVAAEIRRIVDDLAADLVITFGPEGVYLHPDHVHVHQAVAFALNSETVRRGTATNSHTYFVAVPREFFTSLGVGPGSPFEGTPKERFEQMGTPKEKIDIIVDVQSHLGAK